MSDAVDADARVMTQPFASVAELVALVLELREESKRLFWFRGHSNAEYTLTPKLCRSPGKSAQAVQDREARLLARFRERSLPFWPAGPSSSHSLEYMFSMQHYGVATRLLDWSENLLIAAYFATDSDRLGEERDKDPESSPAVWLLDPYHWNKHVKAIADTPIGILTLADEESTRWAPAKSTGETLNRRPKEPVALYGTYNSPRIVAQRGAFTLHGTDMRPLEEMAADEPALREALRKYEYTGTCRDLHDELSFFGFTESMIYPDLSHLAQELQRMEGWE